MSDTAKRTAAEVAAELEAYPQPGGVAILTDANARMLAGHLRRLEDALAVLREAREALKGLADQQAMPDDTYRAALASIEKLLTKEEG